MCSNGTSYQNSNWITIQSGKTQNGICIDNYYGSPTRQCLQNGSNNSIGVWDSTVNNPCNRNILIYNINFFLTTKQINSNHVFK